MGGMLDERQYLVSLLQTEEQKEFPLNILCVAELYEWLSHLWIVFVLFYFSFLYRCHHFIPFIALPTVLSAPLASVTLSSVIMFFSHPHICLFSITGSSYWTNKWTKQMVFSFLVHSSDINLLVQSSAGEGKLSSVLGPRSTKVRESSDLLHDTIYEILPLYKRCD